MWNEGEQVKFQETQTFPVWVYLLIGGVIAFGIASNIATAISAPQLRMSMLTGGLIGVTGLGLTMNLLYVKTVVTEKRIRVTFGRFFTLYRRNIPRFEIEKAEAITYSPIRDYGGWGIRGFGDNIALNAKGDRGVLVTLKSGKRIMIGSQRADEFAEALRKA